MGFDRKEFLYELRWWEIRSIIRGYSRRHILQYQLQRITAYSAFYSMRENKEQKTPSDWMPLYFDKYDESESSSITQEDLEEADEMQAMLDDINSGKVPFDW